VTAREVLDGINTRLAAATPGPWAVEYDNNDDYEAGISYGDFPYCIRGPRNVSLTASELEKPFWQDHKNRVSEVSEMSEDDAQLIANAPTDVARLTRAVEAVLELHTPRESPPLSFREIIQGKQLCDSCLQPYPCPTVAAIEKALNP